MSETKEYTLAEVAPHSGKKVMPLSLSYRSLELFIFYFLVSGHTIARLIFRLLCAQI